MHTEKLEKAYSTLLSHTLHPLPFEQSSSSSSFTIKVKDVDFHHPSLQKELENLGVEFKSKTEWNFRKTLAPQEFLKTLRCISRVKNHILEENLDNLNLWGVPKSCSPIGFDEKKDSSSKKLLDDLYADEFIVKEKKSLIIDLSQSFESYLVSINPSEGAIIDAAAQIASLGIGINDPRYNTLGLRPEILDPEFTGEEWDVTKAYHSFLKEKSKLPHIYTVNSGSETIETAVRLCQLQHPDRKRLFAFESSFHGRTLFSLHATYNPTKRKPFDIYQERIEFLRFPSWTDPTKPAEEPKSWITTWSQPKSSSFLGEVEKLLISQDAVLREEVLCLLQIKSEFEKELPLAVVVESIQCEGGDRFGSPRFYRALRLLTRAYDVPLVLDEVQAGFGLGGTFFWHEQFHLVDSKGNPDTPDCLCLAKKAQAAFVCSRFEQEIPFESSPSSIYRGYLHALAIDGYDHKTLEKKVKRHLQILQETVGADFILNPRNIGMIFAFDLPHESLVTSFVAKRFLNGGLFYPAGAKTARFRLMATTSDRELVQIFVMIYRCLLDLSEDGVIKKIPTLEEYCSKFEAGEKEIALEKPGIQYQFPWKETSLATKKEEFFSKSEAEWNKIFLKLTELYPQWIRDPMLYEWNSEKLSKETKESLWNRYEFEEDLTLLKLNWLFSRRFGTQVKRWSAEELEKNLSKVQELQDRYEKERQEDPKTYLDLLKNDSDCIFLAAHSSSDPNHLAGLAMLTKLDFLQRVTENEPTPTSMPWNDKNAYYSADLVVSKKVEGSGLGKRLKVEQLLEVQNQKASTLYSRNRYPEALPMTKINLKLGAVAFDKIKDAYHGKGTALYMSYEFHSSGNAPKLLATDGRLPALKNKLTLSNFIAKDFVSDALLIKAILPDPIKHAFFASGRGEAIDKAIKLCIAKKPQARIALSLDGDYFGTTTGCTRSLGGKAGPKLFSWPTLSFDEKAQSSSQIETFKKQMEEQNAENIFGFFIEPIRSTTKQKKSEEFLRACIEICKKKNIPIFFHETESMFYRFSEKTFFASHKNLSPDGIVFHPTGQSGVVACNDELFLDKPLTMISTWDGDEHSLNLFRDQILSTLRAD